MDEGFRDRTAFIRGAKDIAKEVKKHATKKVGRGVDRVQDEYTKRSYSRFEEEDDDEDYQPQDGYYRGEPAVDDEGASSDATEGHDEDDEIYEGEYQGIPRNESLKGGEPLAAGQQVVSEFRDFQDLEGERRKEKEELSQQYELILQECGHGRFQWTLYFVLGLALMADGVEIFVVGFVLPSAEKDMCLSDSNKGMLGESPGRGLGGGGPEGRCWREAFWGRGAWGPCAGPSRPPPKHLAVGAQLAGWLAGRRGLALPSEGPD